MVIQRSMSIETMGSAREIWLAGGCFWGLQKYMDGVYGVLATDVGYANGHTENPTYQAVCAHTTGFAETVRVVYEPQKISLSFLLALFFKVIDPTSVERQGNDIGNQYRSGIYYLNNEDVPVIDGAMQLLAQQYSGPIAVEVEPLASYYLAEDYHQKYLEKNPGGYCHITDKMCAAAQTAREYRKPDDAQIRETLTDLQYKVTQENGTEPPFANPFNDHFEPGIYVDITTGEPLFVSTDKFASGCGWPAFSKPVSKASVHERTDVSHNMRRIEVRSSAGDAHLGHVFTDGPQERGGLRYCINSAALRFVPLANMQEEGYDDYIAQVKG